MIAYLQAKQAERGRQFLDDYSDEVVVKATKANATFKARTDRMSAEKIDVTSMIVSKMAS